MFELIFIIYYLDRSDRVKSKATQNGNQIGNNTTHINETGKE